MPKLPELLRRFAATPPGAREDVIPGEVGKEDPDAAGYADSGWGTDREVNPDLAGNERYARLDEMVMSDPVVHGALLSTKLPMAGSRVTIERASEDPVDKVVAAAAGKLLGLPHDDRPAEHDPWMAGGWDALWWMLSLHLDYGSMTGEKVWGDDVVTWTDPDGDEHPIIPMVRVAPRYPHTLDRYRAGTEPGQPLAQVYQHGIRGALPGAKLVHLVHQPHLARFVGSSLLRPAYGIWKLKRKMIVSAAVGFDRFAAGVPIVRSPGNGGPEEERLARSIGRDYRNHERAYFWLRGKKPGPGDAGWDVEVLNGSGALADPIPQLRHYDEQMVSALMARFFMLGSTDTGSRAVGEVLSEPYYMALNWHLARMCREVTAQILAPWVRANFGPTVDVPRIVPAAIQQRNLPVRGEFLESMQRAGVYLGDVAAQNIIRAWADLPPLPDDYEPTAPGEGESPTPRTGPADALRPPRAIGPTGTPPVEPAGPPRVA